ncbi:MAG: RelA/SpoT family protein [Candidatus Taylorbacteria bacterium]|nr:RelA/SpoT family protein [Candidatus Taylorbacteria bacterium]
MTLTHEPLNILHPPGPSYNEVISKAYSFAKEAHKEHKRATGEPYFNHLVGTANLLIELGMGPVTIASGLLHDSIEDVEIKPETIEKEFGKEIRFLVEGVTKLGRLHYSGAERYTESLRKLFVAISKDVRVLIIKLADRLQNMQGLEFLPKEKRDRIALETLEIYAPLAYRLGIRKVNRELEDLAFPFVFPKEYERVKAELKAKHKENIHNLEKFHKSVLQQLEKDGIHGAKTGYRIKGLYSLYRKLKRKDWDIEKIHDIAALRIIVPNVVDCYRVLGSVHGHWRPLPGQIKDYIAMPKPSNYRGIHTTIFTGDGSIVEVQIRTEEMHRKTEYGMHFEYKETIDNPRANFSRVSWVTRFFPNFIPRTKEVQPVHNQNPEKIPEWIHALGEYNKDALRNDTFFENLKSDFFSDRVFVFTPKGDVFDLPAGSTPIDFAYSLHSGIGNTMSGVKVNNKLVSLNTELENGDIVEVMTKPSSHPSSKWLEIAKTSIAKKHIKIALERARSK